MIKKQKHMNLVIFFAGLLTAFALMIVFSPNKESRAADKYACIRQDLNAKLTSGNIGDTKFAVYYEIPSCYMENGYVIDSVFTYQGNMVAVKYKK